MTQPTIEELIRHVVGEELDRRLNRAEESAPLAYSVNETARLLGCSRRHVYEHIVPVVRTVKSGRRLLLNAKDVNTLVEGGAA